MQAISGETVQCLLKPFTAAKSSDAVAGDDGPVMRFPTKRKAVYGSSYEEGLQPAEEAKLPATAKQAVDLAVDLSALVPVPGRKHRLSKAEIRTILALNPGPLPPTDYLDDLTDVFSPEYIKERKKQLEAHAELCKKMSEESELFRQQIIKSVRDNGYFEVDDEFFINRAKANQRALEHWAKKDFGALRFATEEEEAEMEVPRYVPDKDVAAVLDLLSDDC